MQSVGFVAYGADGDNGAQPGSLTAQHPECLREVADDLRDLEIHYGEALGGEFVAIGYDLAAVGAPEGAGRAEGEHQGVQRGERGVQPLYGAVDFG